MNGVEEELEYLPAGDIDDDGVVEVIETTVSRDQDSGNIQISVDASDADLSLLAHPDDLCFPFENFASLDDEDALMSTIPNDEELFHGIMNDPSFDDLH